MLDMRDRVLVSWIGTADKKGPVSGPEDCGPIARILDQASFARVCLLSDWDRDDAEVNRLVAWLKNRSGVDIHVAHAIGRLASATIGDMFAETRALLAKALGRDEQVAFNVASGVPFMAFTFFLLAFSDHKGARLLRVDARKPVEEITVPFEVNLAMHEAINTQFNEQVFGKSPTSINLEGRQFQSKAMVQVMEKVKRAQFDRDHSALIVSEPGCDAESVAREILSGPVAHRDIVEITCGTFPAEDFDLIMFGSRNKGLLRDGEFDVLFLRDVHDWSRVEQKKLDRALEAGWFRVGREPSSSTRRSVRSRYKIVATAGAEFLESARRGDVDRGLFLRCAVHVIVIPPLRKRPEDIRPLTDTVLQHLEGELGQTIQLSAEAVSRLHTHVWPLNHTELENVVRRAAVNADNGLITADDVEAAIIFDANSNSAPSFPFGSGLSLKEYREKIEKSWIREAMARAQNNQREAARLLGTDKSAFHRALKKLGGSASVED